MLLLSDRRLREYSDLFAKHDNRTIDEVYVYLHTLLSSYVDSDGDGSITKKEMVAALRGKAVGFNLTSHIGDHYHSKLWCKTASMGLEMCYDEMGYDVLLDNATVGVEVMFQDAWDNFKYSLKHKFGNSKTFSFMYNIYVYKILFCDDNLVTFDNICRKYSVDGSGAMSVASMKSWYPDPQLSFDVCISYDRSWNKINYKRIETNYTYVDESRISQVCGYTNGYLIKDEFSISDRLKGLITSFTDTVAYDKVLDGGNYPKRIYCIFVELDNSPLKSFECSVGLSPDGMPIDLEPEFSTNGIIFSYMDTSSGEKEVG
jgi:hypothetical protein